MCNTMCSKTNHRQSRYVKSVAIGRGCQHTLIRPLHHSWFDPTSSTTHYMFNLLSSSTIPVHMVGLEIIAYPQKAAIPKQTYGILSIWDKCRYTYYFHTCILFFIRSSSISYDYYYGTYMVFHIPISQHTTIAVYCILQYIAAVYK